MASEEPNERAWLEALGQVHLLLAHAEREFDDLTRLAAQLCECPLGFVSFFDPEHQHYESKIGSAPTERFTELPLSAEVVRHTDLLIVPDTLLDARLSQNPLVVAEPFVRFFAAAPLLTPHGHPVGSLSVIDWAPRELSPEQQHALRTLGRQASNQIELLRLRLSQPRATLAAELGVDAELREIASLLSGALESTSEGILAVDNEGRIVVYSRRFAEMWQLPAPAEGDLRGSVWPIPEALAQLQDPQALGEIPQATGRRDALEAQVLSLRDGRVFEAFALPRWVDARKGGTMWRFRDITEKHRAEEALRKEEELKQAQKMDAVGRVAAGVAHDFNNVLTIILAYSELIAARLPPSDQSRREAELVGQAAQRAATLTGRLLAFSRKSAGQRAVFDLSDLARGMEPLLQPLLQQIRLTFALPDKPVWVEADHGQIEQVVLNLVVNARDAMPEGGIITVELATAPSEARLTVRDTGIGIPPDVLPRIFEPFFTTKEVGRGTGLGLATTRSIVEQNGGKVSVASEVGHGTAFTVALPLAERAVRRAAAQPDALPAKPGTVVLVVQEEEQLRAIIRRVLEEDGYFAVAVANADEAGAELARAPRKPALLVTDVAPRGWSGQDLARTLTTFVPTMRILYVAGSPAEMASLPVADATQALQKPFTARALRDRVARMLHT